MELVPTPATFEAAEPQLAWFTAFTSPTQLREIRLSPATVVRLLDPGRERSQRLFRKLASPTNHHVPSYHLPTANCDELEQLLRLATARFGWHLFELDLVPEDSVTHRQIEELRLRGWKVDLRPWQTAAVIDLDENFERYQSRISKHLRSDIRNAERRLSRLGELTFDDLATRTDWERCLQAAFELEEKGWKGSAGTAIAQSAATLAFYTAAIRYFRASGQFLFYGLRLDGMLVAFNLIIIHADVAVIWKISFDPDYRRYSPGNILQLRVLEQLVKREDIHKVDIMYPMTDWKRRWGSRAENRLRATIYADTPVMRTAFAIRLLLKRIRTVAKSRPNLCG